MERKQTQVRIHHHREPSPLSGRPFGSTIFSRTQTRNMGLEFHEIPNETSIVTSEILKFLNPIEKWRFSSSQLFTQRPLNRHSGHPVCIFNTAIFFHLHVQVENEVAAQIFLLAGESNEGPYCFPRKFKTVPSRKIVPNHLNCAKRNMISSYSSLSNILLFSRSPPS